VEHQASEDPLSRRRDYGLGALAEGDVDPDPFVQFRRWLSEATDASAPEPNAMVLGTVDPDGRPSARTVLLRGLDHGFLFFTNRDSRKGRALAARPVASLLFPWYSLQRQVIVLGDVEEVSDGESDAYFASRPWGSRIAARASRQSQPITSRAALQDAVAAEEAAFPESGPVPRPNRWGGYRLVPTELEFWQGRPSRLHDRLRFERDVEAGGWRVTRLQP
jgi:pyridoxamine 5'-phosphate oxidase